jgi:putative lipoic acid-binding regulatory protein
MNATPPDKDSLIEYPCDFPIKVMGLKVEGYLEAMSYVVRQFDPDWTEDRLETRESAGGKYLSLTFTVRATSREQLDELYRTLSSHPMAKVVL